MNKNVENVENVVTTPDALKFEPAVTSQTAVATVAEITPMDYRAALAGLPDVERKAVLDLAEQIDVTETDKVMNYGAAPLVHTFEQCGQLLKEERGSDADQVVIRQVIELSKRANEKYEDFNMTLKEPNMVEGLVMKAVAALTGKKKSSSRTKDMRAKAVSSYDLLNELNNSCSNWIDILRNNMEDISDSGVDDRLTVGQLEKYLIAGYLAMERVNTEMEEKKRVYETTGLQQDEDEYNALKEGAEILQIVLSNMERSKLMYKVSIGQLELEKRANRSLQIDLNSKQRNTSVLISQQLRNALINAKNREVLEGRNALVGLSNELVAKMSQNIALTAQESEVILRSGFYDMEAAKTAITHIISACDSIEKTRQEWLPKLKSELDEAYKLMDQLEPYVSKIRSNVPDASSKAATSSAISTPKGGLTF